MSRRVKILRLIYWACWAAAIGYPTVGLVSLRHAVGIGTVIDPLAFIGICFASAELADDQPKLAQAGMVSLAIAIIINIPFLMLGPIT
jgi:hypothetical protein